MFSLVRSPVCPSCGTSSIRRSRRKGLLEFLLHQLLSISPYRCRVCDERYYRHSSHQLESASHKSAHKSAVVDKSRWNAGLHA